MYVPGGEKVITPANQIIFYVTSLPKGLVFLAADSHPRNSKHFKVNGGKWPVHCIKDTWDAFFHKGLCVPLGARIFYKGTGENEDGYDPWGGKNQYGQTPLDVIHGIDSVEIYFFGLATNFCLMSGVLNACGIKNLFGKFEKVCLVVDACRAVPDVSPTEQEAIEKMEAAGAIMTTTREVINDRV